MINPTTNESAAAECIVWERVWAYGCTETRQQCAFEGWAFEGGPVRTAGRGQAGGGGGGGSGSSIGGGTEAAEAAATAAAAAR